MAQFLMINMMIYLAISYGDFPVRYVKQPEGNPIKFH